MQNESERVVEQYFDAPMPQIMEEIVKVEAIVDISVQQIEFFFGWSFCLFFCCGMERCTRIYFFKKKSKASMLEGVFFFFG